jgi:mycothiol synthase
MKPTYRPYQQEADFWQMRDFLRRVYLLNERRSISWHVARLEYARWHVCLNCAEVTLDQVAHLWELDGRLVAMMMPDGGPGEAHLSVQPEFKTAVLEAEMLDIVGGYSEAANALYRSVMSSNGRNDCLLYSGWLKEW